MKAKLQFVFDILKTPIGTKFYYEVSDGDNGFASKISLIRIVLKNWHKGVDVEILE